MHALRKGPSINYVFSVGGGGGGGGVARNSKDNLLHKSSLIKRKKGAGEGVKNCQVLDNIVYCRPVMWTHKETYFHIFSSRAEIFVVKVELCLRNL